MAQTIRVALVEDQQVTREGLSLLIERVCTRLATDLHDDLGSGLAQIAILSEVAMREKLPRSIELLHGVARLARSLRESLADIVWTVDPREDSLVDLVVRLRQVAFTNLEDTERPLEFFAPADEELQQEIAPEVRRHVLLLSEKPALPGRRNEGSASAAFDAGNRVGGQFGFFIEAMIPQGIRFSVAFPASPA